ncbi:MAG: Hsp70 family protein [Blastocatellales bacterium]
MSKIVVGIDLGTTYSAIAYVDDGGRPRVIPNADGKTTTPSAVLIQNGRIAVGDVALNQWVTNEEYVVRWIKRAMGDAGYRFQGLSPVEISAEILKALKADAELYLGEQIEEAVITCPAYFAAIEIENTKLAGEMAGLRVREIVKEPTAAAVYYGVEQMRDGETILVCDLGGGTFDATVLAYKNGVFAPLATKGDRQLGGHDWTMDLVELVAERLEARFGDDPRNDLLAGQMLYEACEQAKRDYARLTEVAIPCHFQGRMEQVVVTRDDFEARTEYKIQEVVGWAEQSLAKAQPALTWKEIDRILLVGGSSRLRRLSLALEEASGKKPVQTGEPDLMVALGAAILARGQVRPRKPAGGLVEAAHGGLPGGLIDVDYLRVIARSLGTRVIVTEKNKPRITNSLIIPHGTESPVSRSRDDYEISSPGQPHFDVPVVEFESDDDFDVVGNFRFTCPPTAGRGDRVEVTFHYDISGIPTVEARDLKTGQRLASERLDYQEPNLEEFGRLRLKPRWVVFAIDASYSMEGEKMRDAKKALVDNARDLLSLSGEGCKIGIVSFASTAQIVCRPTADIAAIKQAADGIFPSGMTAMDDGIRQAIELVMAAPAGVDRDVVMVTDGMPDGHRRHNTLAMAEEAKRKGVTLSSVGIGDTDVDLDFLRQLSPLSLVIENASGVGAAMTSLLTQSAQARGGLMDAPTGGLSDVED